MEPRISIIIPVYNVDKYLDFCMKSVIGQLYKNLEIILVDDGSTDNSGKMCDEYARVDSRVKVIHKENGGLSSARNTGMRMMTGDYFSFIDSDDFVRKDYISKMYAYMRKDNTDIVMCSVKKVMSEENYTFLTEKFDQYQVFDCETIKMKMLSRQIPMYAPGKLFKTEIAREVFFPVGRLYEDIPTIWKITKNVKKGTYIEEQLYFYRQRLDSIVNAQFKVNRMDGVYFTEEIANEFCERDRLYNFAISCCFFCAVDNYSLINNEFPKEKEYLINCIKKYRIIVLKDREAQKSLRLMALVACILPQMVGVLGKAYKKCNYLKWKIVN